jgi:hypothetical protein
VPAGVFPGHSGGGFRQRARLCLKTLWVRLLGLGERLCVGFARRIAWIRRGAAASIRAKIPNAANLAEFSART